MIDLVVPTVTGREESLDRCLASFPDTNPVVIKDQPTCGLAWIEGIRRSSGDYLILCCDDIEATDPAYDVCVDTVDAGFLPCPVISRPDGALESAGGDMAAPGCLIPHIQADWTPVDFVPLPFVGRDQIRQIRMIEAHYMTDVWVSHRGRQLGFETVLRTDWQLTHHHEMTGRKEPSPDDHAIFNQQMSEAAE